MLEISALLRKPNDGMILSFNCENKLFPNFLVHHTQVRIRKTDFSNRFIFYGHASLATPNMHFLK